MSHVPIAKLGFIATLLLLLACGTRKQETAAIVPPATTAPAEEPPAVQPPPAEHVTIVKGDAPATSELALLMRAMTAFADSTRLRVAQGRELLPFPEKFKTLKTAEATPGMKDPKVFDAYDLAWLHHLDALYKAPEPERAGVFNTLVQTCAGCHGTMCPGPLVKIKKLGLPAR